MISKPPRLRRRQATSNEPQTSASGPTFGPLSVSALAGLIAATLALFVLVTWLAVILIRRRKRRHRGLALLEDGGKIGYPMRRPTASRKSQIKRRV
jgi:hypothetical protein